MHFFIRHETCLSILTTISCNFQFVNTHTHTHTHIYIECDFYFIYKKKLKIKIFYNEIYSIFFYYYFFIFKIDSWRHLLSYKILDKVIKILEKINNKLYRTSRRT